MSADTGPSTGADPTAEIEGFHDRLDRAEEAADDGRWNDVLDLLHGAKSVAMKQRAEAARRGDLDV